MDFIEYFKQEIEAKSETNIEKLMKCNIYRRYNCEGCPQYSPEDEVCNFDKQKGSDLNAQSD